MEEQQELLSAHDAVPLPRQRARDALVTTERSSSRSSAPAASAAPQKSISPEGGATSHEPCVPQGTREKTEKLGTGT